MKAFIYSLIIVLVMTLGAVSLDENIDHDLQSGLLRLHIVADSDEVQAQAVKLKVRDAVLAQVHPEDKNFLESAETAANRVLAENGMDYRAKAYYGRFYFPTKQYKNITLPAGKYYGVRLVLGRGSGKNWWCILYPPMCMVNDREMALEKDSAEILKRTLTPQSYELITAHGDKIQVRFKTVEIIRKIQKKFVK